jgi:hypothetical protein
MDELTDSYGRLSTTAKEWKPPPSASSASSMRQSSSTSTTSNSYNTATPQSPSPISPRPVSSVLHQSPPGRNTPAMSTGNPASWQLEPRNNEWVPSAGATNKDFVPGTSWNSAPLAPLQQVSWGQGSDGKFCSDVAFFVVFTLRPTMHFGKLISFLVLFSPC